MKALGLSPTEQVKLNLPDDRLIFHVLDKRNMLEKRVIWSPKKGARSSTWENWGIQR